ncbi:hypothetical protein PG985_012546 [Apiospora marii]|uniref:Uncharacterized protein n=1 Tax=Apiospora marii TaxID=335849 RepID=A0ABR1RCY3_9PEZI
MGNVPSKESPERGGRMAPHKLSKPRTTNVTAAGLSKHPSRPVDLSKRRSLSNRTWSHPYGASPSSPLPPLPPLPDLGDFDQPEPTGRPEGASRTLSVKSLFRSRSSKEASKRPGRTNSIGAMVPSPSPAPSSRPTRANSMIVVDGAGHYAQTAGWPISGSNLPFNYDPTSYEAKRLSYLMETPIYIEDLSMMSDTQTTGSRRGSHSEANPVYPTTPSIPRASSDVSMYTPMRRRSLLTPGLATRASPTPPVPHKSKHRFSMPPTPSPRDSDDGLEIGMFAMRPSTATHSESVPRAATPTDEGYAQTGAFKLGTLRITNGSPVTSPISNVDSGVHRATESKQGQDYFHQPQISEPAAQPPQPDGIGQSALLTPGYLPQICVSPIRLDEVKLETEELQTTSKTTALEDDLFEVEPDSPRPEVLDVRVDPSAKSHPRPRLAAEKRRSKEIGRSDSGIVASPTSDYSHQSLSKADSGYSSNVSLRSFSKPTAPKKTELCANTPPDTPNKESAILHRPISASPDLVDPSSSREATPPPVPDKDAATKSTDSPGRHKSWSLSRSPFSKRAKNSAPLAINLKSQLSPALASEVSPLSPTTSIISNSGLSISSITRKNGKLHRFLSSGRKSHEAQAPTQAEEAEVPSTPLAETTFADQLGPLPLPRKRWDLRAEPSKETLGTIMSVGSAEYDNSPKAPKAPRDGSVPSTRKPRNDGQCITSSTALQSAAPATEPTVRKSVPIWKSMVTTPLAASISPEPEATPASPTGAPAAGGRLRTSSMSGSGPRKSHVRRRSTTMNAQMEKDLSMRHSGATNMVPPAMPAANEARPVSQVSTVESLGKRIRSPPPVSMRTRNNGDYIKNPIRAQSTPPAAMRQALSRKSSREGIQSFPSTANLGPSIQGVHHGYPPVAEGYRGCAPVSPKMPDLSRQLSVAFSTETGSFRRPNWDLQPDHHNGTRSGTSSVNPSRQNSFTRQTSQPQGHVIARPKLAPLHHRYSYDGYSLQQFQPDEDAVFTEAEQILSRDTGPYPSMVHKDGQEYVTDPWSGRPMPQVLGNQGRYPPYVPRGHFRNRSMGADQHHAPYRVLHSYNSPAYKNAPIWG